MSTTVEVDNRVKVNPDKGQVEERRQRKESKTRTVLWFVVFGSAFIIFATVPQRKRSLHIFTGLYFIRLFTKMCV